MEVGYNRNLVAKALHCYRNTTLAKYVNELRLIKATELLAQPELSVEVVAEQCGFGSITTLMRNFKQVYGITPFGVLAIAVRNEFFGMKDW